MVPALLIKAKNAAVTLPQIYTPQLAAALVRKLTSGSSKKSQDGKASAPTLPTLHTLKVGEPGERYTPPAPADGATGGVAAAQFAAAQPVPATQLDRRIKPIE